MGRKKMTCPSLVAGSRSPMLSGLEVCVGGGAGARKGSKQEDCINLWSAGEWGGAGAGCWGCMSEPAGGGTPHNQAPVSAVSRRLILLVSIPATAPLAPSPECTYCPV